MKPTTRTCLNKECKSKFTPQRNGQGVCSYKCGIAYSNWLEERKRKEKDKQERKRTREMKEKIKTLTQLESEAKKEFQKFIRLRDRVKPCISCGTTNSPIWDGGHFYKAEIYSGLIFNEKNCHRQCRKCNSFLGGNENQYRLGLIERYGEDYVKELDKLAIELRDYKYTREELIELKKKYRNKAKVFET